MRFGVVACAHCRRVQAVELRFERVRCVACRKPFGLKERRYFYRGDEDAVAQATVARVSAQLQGMGIEEYAELLVRLERESPRTLEDVVVSVARRGEFTPEEFGAEMARLGVRGDPAVALDRLVRDNRVFQPRPERYRVL